MTRVAGRGIGVLIVIAAVLLAVANGGQATAAQYSAIVMDMRDGTVLYESNADRRQAPASLTKMMTLYLAFEAVENGQLKLDQEWDSVVLVIMDENYEPYEIYEAERDDILDVMDEAGKSARKKRGAMTVARFKIIARLVWTPEQGELEDEIWDNRSGL